MKVAMLGTGDVGRALGRGFATLGHEVKMGSREARNEKALAWAREVGPKASVGTFKEAALFGEVVVLATQGAVAEEVLKGIGAEALNGKLLVDTTNPLDLSAGMPPRFFVGHTDSLGERVQRAAPGAHVVKAFNSVGNAYMFRPEFPGGPPDMFICGNNADAKKKMESILKDFGWGTVDVGGVEASRFLEPLCLLWVGYGLKTNTWAHAFKLLRK
ncbi:MAG: NAD(P)-binding domain-containing protein [Myxococcota bacterium]